MLNKRPLLVKATITMSESMSCDSSHCDPTEWLLVQPAFHKVIEGMKIGVSLMEDFVVKAPRIKRIKQITAGLLRAFNGLTCISFFLGRVHRFLKLI